MNKQFYVNIEDFVGPFRAYETGASWNGWECPAFDFDTACDVALALIEQHQIAGYDSDTRSFFTVLSEPVDSWADLNTLARNDPEFDWQAYGVEAGHPMVPDELAPGVHLDTWKPLTDANLWSIGGWAWCWDEVDVPAPPSAHTLHYHVGYRQPGFDPVGEVTTYPSRDEAIAQNRINAVEALAGLVSPNDRWTISGPDEDGDYFVTQIAADGSETFSWHYFVEECGEDHPA